MADGRTTGRLSVIVLVAIVCLLAQSCSSSKRATGSPPLRGVSSTSATSTTTTIDPALREHVNVIVDLAAVAVLLIPKQGGAKSAIALSQAANGIRNLTFPPDAEADAKAVAADLDKLSVDALQNASQAALTNDLGTETAAADALVHDLG